MKTHAPLKRLRQAMMAACATLLTSCASQNLPAIATVPQVDLQRFMGDWYVIACIPTAIETEAYNAVESYRLLEDGTIDTVFTFRSGSIDGKPKRYNPHGFVQPGTGNALWGMQFIWPIKAEYRIAYLNPDYTQTVIARNARDYVWIMARTPSVSDSDYQRLVKFVADLGYDTAKLRKVPQDWTLSPERK
ncbi:MAG TPA: lipocalin family protein [Methylophilaceae bacterium]|nr:lipocalin family protein [Methylophilaceae bacterium]